MEPLTFSAESQVSALARRFNVSAGAIRTALDAVIRGGGSMAQFQSEELGGQVQWIRGGRAMVSDHSATVRQDGVSALCEELSRFAASAVVYDRPASPRAGGASGARARPSTPPERAARGSWYPEELGVPAASGGQNGMHYAVFPETHRLAIDRVGRVDVYDTLDHRIEGVRQAADGAVFDLAFTSQNGTFRVDELPRVGPARPERGASHEGADLDEEK